MDRQNLIEKCLEKRLSCSQANDVLAKNDFSPMENGEADCYEVMRLNTRISNPRQKIIANCLINGLSKTNANLKLYDKKFRKMDEGESYEYEEILSKIRFCGQFVQNDDIPLPQTFEQIFQNGIVNEWSLDEVNQKLVEFGHEKMTLNQEEGYLKKFNLFHNTRQAVIRRGYEDCKTLPEINKILTEQDLTPLNWLEEMEYQRERENIYKKRRLNLIKECLDERLTRGDINKILMKYGYEKLSEQEADRYTQNQEQRNHQTQKTSDLSEQFKCLYRNAIKKFHPDKFLTSEEKTLATTRIKELNEAKDKNDYFLLKDLVERFEKETAKRANPSQ